MNHKPAQEAAEANLVIDQAARDAGRDPNEIRRIFNVTGAFAKTVESSASDCDPAIVGPREHWADVLTHFAADLSFGTFVVVGSLRPRFG
jgi:hypothetical protein